MNLSALLLSRLQFAFTVSFHIVFPSFTIGLAAWLTTIEALHLATGRPAYRIVFEFWLKIFGIAFGLGVVSGIVMAFEFGTNWSELSRVSGPIQGPLLTYETFTAFALEASFFGVLLFGRQRVAPWFYLFSTAMVALGTTFSAFWIMVNNSWMQAPVGYAVENGAFVAVDWSAIIFSPAVWVRFPHMLLASYLTGAFCVAATGAWYLCGATFRPKRASCCAWASISRPSSFRRSSFSVISPATSFTTISPRSSRRSKGAGATSSRRARC
jgi:cytochrome d ubiquinol oxidase subunit I